MLQARSTASAIASRFGSAVARLGPAVARPAVLLPAAAVLVLVTGALPRADAEAVLTRIWPVLLFLAAVTVLAELADDAGLFDLAAAAAARAGRGRVVALWLLVVLLATGTTILLSLDTTAVLLTPVVLALADRLELPALPFAMTTVWLANTASLLLPVANLTNLLAIQRLGWSAATWAARLWAPSVVAVVVTVAVLWLLHRRELRGRYVDPGRPRHGATGSPGSVPLLVLAGISCLGLGTAVSLGTPPWAAACTAAAVLVVGYLWRRPERLAPSRLPDLAPWRLVVTTVSIFLVVAAADRHGLAVLLRDLAGVGGGAPVVEAIRAAGVGALGSNAVNNLPAYLAVEPAVSSGNADSVRLVGLVVGTNVGPLITVWASLATLLWRERCRSRGLTISWRRFGLEGLALVVPLVVLTAVTAGLT